jgi:hypothetical protein
MLSKVDESLSFGGSYLQRKWAWRSDAPIGVGSGKVAIERTEINLSIHVIPWDLKRRDQGLDAGINPWTAGKTP